MYKGLYTILITIDIVTTIAIKVADFVFWPPVADFAFWPLVVDFAF